MRVREFHKEDITLFNRWLYMPHVSQWYHEPQDWLYEVEDKNGEYTWINHYIVEEHGKEIGFCQYYEYSNSGETWHGTVEVRGTYSIDYMIGEPDYLRKGIGRQIVLSLVELIRKEGDAKRIIVQPELENEASCRTLLASGFTYDEGNTIFIMEL